MIELDWNKLDLAEIARHNLGRVRRNLTTPMLYEESIKNREGLIAHLGPLVVRTGQCSERSLDDRFVVREPESQDNVWWSGRNRELALESFKRLAYRVLAYLQNKDIYVQECFAGAPGGRRVALRIVTEHAWHSLFARNMYYPAGPNPDGGRFEPEFSIVHVPGFQAVPEIDGTSSSACVIVHLDQRLVFIGGTSYAHEIKDAVFGIVNYLVPQAECLSLRCAVNVGPDGDVAAFMGRSGTGKTSLATCPGRRLIGDDHHGWDADGLQSYERGCYAKLLGLSAERQPLIFECTRKFGTILENVTLDGPSRRVDLGDDSLTDNARAAYPLPHIPTALRHGRCDHPRNLFLCTHDPFGVFPPLARLTPEQVYFTFLSSYQPGKTDGDRQARDLKVLSKACFGHTPLVVKPHDYARLLMDKVERLGVNCWLLNTGYSGEPLGSDRRVTIETSRLLVAAATGGRLDDVEFEVDPVFQFEIPRACPGLDAALLDPRKLARDPGEYEMRASRLATDLMNDFSQFTPSVPDSVKRMLANITLLEDSLDLLDQFRITI